MFPQDDGVKPMIEFRYGKYEFESLSAPFTSTSGGGRTNMTIAPVFQTYDITGLAAYRKGWGPFYVEFGGGVGFGWKTWDFGYDTEKWEIQTERFKTSTLLPLQLPYRLHFRAGLRL